MADYFHSVKDSAGLRQFVVEDAQLADAQVRWPDARGIPSPSHQLGSAGTHVVEDALQLGDFITIGIEWPRLPHLVRRLVHVSVWVGTYFNNQTVLGNLGHGATFIPQSLDPLTVIPLHDVVQTYPNRDDWHPQPYLQPNGDVTNILSRHYVSEQPGQTESDDTFRRMDTTTESRINMIVGNSAIATALLIIGWQIRWLCWPENGRRLGILRTPELYIG